MSGIGQALGAGYRQAVSRMMTSRLFYIATIASYLALLGLLLLWHTWLVPPVHWPVALVLLVWVVPLLLPLRGLLHGRRYTYAWFHFLTLWYFIHGVGVIAADPAARILGVGEVILSVLLYLVSIVYVRVSREDK